MSLDFTINSLLFSDDVISSKHKNKGKMSIEISLLLSILSNTISHILSFFFVRLTSFSMIYQEMTRELHINNNVLIKCSKIIHIINRRIIIYYTVTIILLLIFHLL